MKTFQTINHRYYVATVTEKATVTDKATGLVLAKTDEEGQVAFLALGVETNVSDNNAVVVPAPFNGASLGSSAGRGQSLASEQLKALYGASADFATNSFILFNPDFPADHSDTVLVGRVTRLGYAATSIGVNNSVDNFGVAAGYTVTAREGAVSVGSMAVGYAHSVSVGLMAHAETSCVSIGADARSFQLRGTAIGESSRANSWSVAIGYDACAFGYYSSVVGSGMHTGASYTSVISAHNGSFLFSFLGVDHSGATPRLIAGVYDRLACRVTTGAALPMTDFVALLKANGGADYSFDNLQQS